MFAEVTVGAVVQTAIAVLGCLALYMAMLGSRQQKLWAPFVGISGQPFFLYSAYENSQFGMFICAVLYTIVWAMSCRNSYRELRNAKRV